MSRAGGLLLQHLELETSVLHLAGHETMTLRPPRLIPERLIKQLELCLPQRDAISAEFSPWLAFDSLK